MQRCRADILSARAYRITAALAAHIGVGVGLLDMPFVQPGQAHGDTLAAEGHTAFQQRFAAGMERPRPGQAARSSS